MEGNRRRRMRGEAERVGGRVRLRLERRRDGDDERKDVDDREREQEAVRERASPTSPPHGARIARCAGADHGAPPGAAEATREAFGSPTRCVGPKRRRRGTRSGLRVRSRVAIVKKTMIAKRMKAIAAPTPHSLLLNEALN